MDSDIVLALKKRYSHLPPLLFSRSAERARNETELFDILDTVPDAFPLAWDDREGRWVRGCLFSVPPIQM